MLQKMWFWQKALGINRLSYVQLILCFHCTYRTTEKTIADSLPIENLSENPSPREITKVSIKPWKRSV